MLKSFALTLISLPLLLSGCASPKYACGVPDGIGCKPLSDVHRMAKDGTLKMRSAPNNREEEKPKKQSAKSDLHKLAGRPSTITKTDDNAAVIPVKKSTPEVVTVTPGAPILIPPRTMRVWVARWPDEDGTLHDETYLYLKLDNGRWVVE